MLPIPVSYNQMAPKSAAVKAEEERLEIWDKRIQFVATKVAGTTGILVGGLDYLDPSLLSHNLQQLHHPGAILGAGLAFLCGKSIKKLLGTVLP